MIIPAISVQNFDNSVEKSNKILPDDLKSSAYEQMIGVVINCTPGSLYNWTWAEATGIVTSGNGTEGNPFVIWNINFTSEDYAGYGLEIHNSYKYFQIMDCFFYGNISERRFANNPGLNAFDFL